MATVENYLKERMLDARAYEATTIIILGDKPEEQAEVKTDDRVKEVSFDTLMKDFVPMFKQPMITELYYKDEPDGVCVSFMKNNVLVKCHVKNDNILGQANITDKELTPEEKQGIISAWINKYLGSAIKEE